LSQEFDGLYEVGAEEQASDVRSASIEL